MHRQALKVGFNKEHVKKLSKAEFVKRFKDAYPDNDLPAEYDKIVPPEKEKHQTASKKED